jgi:hypothetical protein
MAITLPDTKVEALKTRVIRGIEYCNTIWQQAKGQADNPEQYGRCMKLLESSVKRLQGLISILNAYGYSKCVFGSCKWNDEGFICLGCSKTQGK